MKVNPVEWAQNIVDKSPVERTPAFDAALDQGIAGFRDAGWSDIAIGAAYVVLALYQCGAAQFLLDNGHLDHLLTIDEALATLRGRS